MTFHVYNKSIIYVFVSLHLKILIMFEVNFTQEPQKINYLNNIVNRRIIFSLIFINCVMNQLNDFLALYF